MSIATNICIHMYLHMFNISICICVPVWMDLCTYVCIYPYLYKYIYITICTYVHTYIHTCNTHIHTYIQYIYAHVCVYISPSLSLSPCLALVLHLSLSLFPSRALSLARSLLVSVSVHPSVCLSVHLFDCLSVRPFVSVREFVCPSVHLFVCLSASPSRSVSFSPWPNLFCLIYLSIYLFPLSLSLSRSLATEGLAVVPAGSQHERSCGHCELEHHQLEYLQARCCREESANAPLTQGISGCKRPPSWLTCWGCSLHVDPTDKVLAGATLSKAIQSSWLSQKSCSHGARYAGDYLHDAAVVLLLAHVFCRRPVLLESFMKSIEAF